MSSQSDLVTTVDLLRHGACEGGEIYRGSTDVVLSAQGWQQMEQATMQAAPWQRVVTSPLIRCRAFAEQCATRLDIPLRVDAGLREMDFGEWEGRLLKDVWHSDKATVSAFYEDPEAVAPPGGEPTLLAQQRMVEAWHTLMGECAGQHLLLVCHGGVIRLLLSHLLRMPLSAIARLHIPYASISRVQVYKQEGQDFPVLMSLNSSGEQR
ncbi:Adenosylcobalamin/alpha-ribazole phosphatase [Halioglobus japonicus]|nr:Adenosylcobalamin/alpha-ribazole phosphatase [Halioglobus japonicus]